jgi:hypothetical protein
LARGNAQPVWSRRSVKDCLRYRSCQGRCPEFEVNAVVSVTPVGRVLENADKCLFMLGSAMLFADMRRGNIADKRARRKHLRFHLLNAYLATLWMEDSVNEMKSIDAKTAYVRAAAVILAMHRNAVGALLIHPTLIESEITTAQERLRLLITACRLR